MKLYTKRTELGASLLFFHSHIIVVYFSVLCVYVCLGFFSCVLLLLLLLLVLLSVLSSITYIYTNTIWLLRKRLERFQILRFANFLIAYAKNGSFVHFLLVDFSVFLFCRNGYFNMQMLIFLFLLIMLHFMISRNYCDKFTHKHVYTLISVMITFRRRCGKIWCFPLQFRHWAAEVAKCAAVWILMPKSSWIAHFCATDDDRVNFSSVTVDQRRQPHTTKASISDGHKLVVLSHPVASMCVERLCARAFGQSETCFLILDWKNN